MHLPRFLRVACPLALVLAACTDGVSPDGEAEVRVAFSLQAPLAVSQPELDAIGLAFSRIDSYEVAVTDSSTGAVVLSTTLPVVGAGSGAHVLDLSFSDAKAGLAVHVAVIARLGPVEYYRATGYTRIVATPTPAPVHLSLRYTGPGIRGTVIDGTAAPIAGATVQLRQGTTMIASTTTELDGTYLFLPASNGGALGTGVYQVSVSPPAQEVVCPAARTLTVTAGSAHLANFATKAFGCAIDLLIVSGGDVDDTQAVAALFASSPNVIARTFFFVNALPGVEYLSQFDAVLLFANGQFNESVMLGSEIAAYVQAGGNVVIGSFYWQNRSDANLGSPGWGTLEDIDPFSSLVDSQTGTGGETYRADSLGQVTTGDALTSDALVQGLTSLTSTGYRGGVMARSGTTVVAHWSDGTPLIGYRILPGGQRLVAISLFPASGAAATGAVTTLWDNAVQWTGEAGGPVGSIPSPPPVVDAIPATTGTPANAQTSQRITSGTSIQTFDDFMLTSPAAVESVEWQGIYCVQTVAAPAPTATAFTVGFYPDVSDAPDFASPLSVATYPMSRVAETFVFTNTNATCGSATPTSIPMYQYALRLNTPFVAAPGVRYWLSVQAHTPNLTVFWGWRSGTASNSRSIQRNAAGGTVVFTSDRALALRAR